MLKVREQVRREELRPPQKMWMDNKYYNELSASAAALELFVSSECTPPVLA